MRDVIVFHEGELLVHVSQPVDGNRIDMPYIVRMAHGTYYLYRDELKAILAQGKAKIAGRIFPGSVFI